MRETENTVMGMEYRVIGGVLLKTGANRFQWSDSYSDEIPLELILTGLDEREREREFIATKSGGNMNTLIHAVSMTLRIFAVLGVLSIPSSLKADWSITGCEITVGCTNVPGGGTVCWVNCGEGAWEVLSRQDAIASADLIATYC